MHRNIDIFTVNAYNYNYYIHGIIPSYMSKLVTGLYHVQLKRRCCTFYSESQVFYCALHPAATKTTETADQRRTQTKIRWCDVNTLQFPGH